ncbi:hypothetical protein HK101_002169 [Irineochytrium annulatum]|nr:hypothetical protein HK101_002169 [Irineochytrium annulatum]
MSSSPSNSHRSRLENEPDCSTHAPSVPTASFPLPPEMARAVACLLPPLDALKLAQLSRTAKGQFSFVADELSFAVTSLRNTLFSHHTLTTRVSSTSTPHFPTQPAAPGPYNADVENLFSSWKNLKNLGSIEWQTLPPNYWAALLFVMNLTRHTARKLTVNFSWCANCDTSHDLPDFPRPGRDPLAVALIAALTLRGNAVDLLVNDMFALRWVAAQDDVESLEILLAKANLKSNQRVLDTVFSTAVNNMSGRCAGFLLRKTDYQVTDSSLSLAAEIAVDLGGADVLVAVLARMARDGIELNDLDLLIKSACQKGHDKVLMMLLLEARGGSRRMSLEICACTLNFAVDHQAADMVRLLLTVGEVDPSAGLLEVHLPDEHAVRRPLLKACDVGDTEIVQLLLRSNRVDPTVEDNAPIKLAVVGNHLQLFRLLLRLQAVRKSLDANELLDVAAAKGGTDVVSDLLRSGLLKNSTPCGGIAQAAFHGHTRIVQLLLHSLVNITPHLAGESLIAASANDHPDIVDTFLRLPPNRIDPTFRSNASLRIACERGNEQIVRMLLADPRVDPSDLGDQALTLACKLGHTRIAELLLNTGRVDPSADGSVALRHAAREGRAAILQMLIDTGRADPAADDNQAIRAASAYGHAECASILLACSTVDPACSSNTSIRSACERGHLRVVEILLADDRVDPSALANECIRLASKNGHASVVERLLAHPRVDAAAMDNDAVRLACTHGRASCVSLLLAPCVRSIADGKRREKEALALIRTASARGHEEVVRVLIESDVVGPALVVDAVVRIAGPCGHAHLIRMMLGRYELGLWADASVFAIEAAVMKGFHEVVRAFVWASERLQFTENDQERLLGIAEGADVQMKWLVECLLNIESS